MSVSSPETTAVILIGASDWPKHPQLAGGSIFSESAKGIKEYFLTEESFGLPSANMLDLFNSDEAPSDIDEAIGSFLTNLSESIKNKNSKLLDIIIYYVGHGGFSGQNNDYFLSVKKTRNDHIQSSGLAIAALSKTLNKNVASQRKYIILDACFSASAYNEFQSAPMQVVQERTTELFRKGTALLCSSGPKTPSKAPQGEQYTMFSGALLEVLNKGVNEKKEPLTFTEVCEMTKEIIFDKYSDEAVRPQLLSPNQEQGDISLLPLFPNIQSKKISFENRISSLEVDVNNIITQMLPQIKDEYIKLSENQYKTEAKKITAEEDNNSSGRFGLSAKEWRALPGLLKIEVINNFKERMAGAFWLLFSFLLLSIAISAYFIPALSHFYHYIMSASSIIATTAIYLLFRNARFLELTENKEIDDFQKWRDLEIVIEAETRNSIRIISGVNVSSSYFIIGTVVYFITAIGSILTYFQPLVVAN